MGGGRNKLITAANIDCSFHIQQESLSIQHPKMKEPCSFLTTNNRNHKLFILISSYQRRKQITNIFKLKSLNSVWVSDVLICCKDVDNSPLTSFLYTLSHCCTLFQLLCQNTLDIRPNSVSLLNKVSHINASTLGTCSAAILHRPTMFSTAHWD